MMDALVPTVMWLHVEMERRRRHPRAAVPWWDGTRRKYTRAAMRPIRSRRQRRA